MPHSSVCVSPTKSLRDVNDKSLMRNDVCCVFEFEFVVVVGLVLARANTDAPRSWEESNGWIDGFLGCSLLAAAICRTAESASGGPASRPVARENERWVSHIFGI